MNKSESLVNLAAAMVKAQAEMPVVIINAKNDFLNTSYADLGAVIVTAKPILAKHGLCILQPTISDSDGVGIENILLHSSGEFIATTITMAIEPEKGKSRAQVAGSIISYLRRYGIASILGMYADKDDDGNVPKPATPQQQYHEAAAKSQAPTGVTLERALIMTNSEGVKYGELPSEKLQAMQLGINKALKNNGLNPEDRKVYEDKLAASKAILAARRSGEIS